MKKKYVSILATVCCLIFSANSIANTIDKGKPSGSFLSGENSASYNFVDVKKLSSVINSQSYEHPIYISEINSGLIYYSDIMADKGNQMTSREFYFTKFDSTSNSWTAPINLTKDYSKFLEENKIMNFDEIYVTIENDIYVIHFNEETFNPHAININTKSIECSPSLSPDGSTLYFVSDRKGSTGGKDIYAAERLSNGFWSTPYNLGKVINTPEDEESPNIMSDGATFYFSSKGHFSFGGYDIFESTQNDEGLWNTPEQLSAPINSTSDDFNYIIDSNGRKAYYSSDKLEKGNVDIFSVKWQSAN